MNENSKSLALSIVIPTYGRDQVLINTVLSLLSLQCAAAEIIVVDQSIQHDAITTQQLNEWDQQNKIKLIKLNQPSIPHAMNTGLLQASNSIVLFLDDDIKAHEGLVETHFNTQMEHSNQITAGKVIQPWDEKVKFSDDGHQFNSDVAKPVNHFMGGNFSINKNNAIELGGFDENFIGVAYRFEKEFADRWLTSGNAIQFEPGAVIDHLKVTSGGTRKYGEHLTTINPHHAVGAYYYYLVSPKVLNKAIEILKRLFQSIKTSHHLKRPWYIPVTLIAEVRGILQAIQLKKSGPKFIRS